MDIAHGQSDEMSLEESQDLLRKCRYGRLGLVFEGEPYVVPVSHIYDGDRIWFHVSKEGKKTTYMQANPEVCFQVDEWLDSGWASVICYGTVTLSEDVAGKHQFGKLAWGYDLPGEELGAMDMYVCTLEITEITGRKSPGYGTASVNSAAPGE